MGNVGRKFGILVWIQTLKAGMLYTHCDQSAKILLSSAYNGLSLKIKELEGLDPSFMICHQKPGNSV